ncbi:MAG: DUF1015 domain-containing protein [Ruminococcus sp.]|nr:DUF1015 domain-containing protein [Ruminococcus sp.]
MAQISAFKGLRFDTDTAGNIRSLCCPPYDIISEQQRLGYINENEYNIIRLELPKEGENPYATAKDILKLWEDKGVLIREEAPALYIYEEEFTAYGKRNSIKGLICRLKVEEFSKGVVLPHEFTLSKAKEDRLNLMKATNCNFSQIYGLYMDEEHTSLSTIDKASEGDADLQFTDDEGITHRMWIVTDERTIAKLVADFDSRKIYIADGHHRYETALNYRNWCREEGISKEGDAQDYQMIFLCDMGHPGLVVFPTHRLVRDLDSFNKEQVLAKCEKYFDIEKHTGTDNMEQLLCDMDKEGRKSFGFYTGQGEWYQLTLKDLSVMDDLLPELSIASRRLDVTVLHSLVLEEIFGIDKENMAQQINLTYTKFFEEAVSAVDEGKAQCSFVLNPTKVTEIRDVASEGEKMPQKSTYFYPKMITGMVMNKLD